MTSISGLGSGLDINTMITQLMAIERRSQQMIQQRRTTEESARSAWSTLNTRMGDLRTAAQALSRPSNFALLSATSSNTDAVTATASGTGTTGSVSFKVDTLAAAEIKAGASTVSSTSAVVGTGNLLVAAGGGKLGFSTLAQAGGLALGSHTIQVTQASAAATKTGSSAMAASTVIDGTNKGLSVTVNGAVRNVELAEGTYTQAQLADAVETALGAGISTSVSAGKLVLSTTREGSTASLQVTGGTALAALGLSTDGSALTGTDGKVKVGDTETTFATIEAGNSITLNASAGSVTATLAGGLRTGTLTAKNINLGSGTLTDVVNAVNGAAAGVSAAAVKVGDNAWRMQFTSGTTGALNGVNIDGSAFGSLGGFTTITAGQDAQITVGTGAGAYTVSSATNTVSDLMPGLALTLKKTTTDQVTVTTARDTTAIGDRVQKLIDNANSFLSFVKSSTAWDATRRTGGPLVGEGTARSLASQITTAVISAVGSFAPGSAGVSVDKNGVLQFDRSKFTTSLNSDPTNTINAFSQSATATNSLVSFVSARDKAKAGDYAVNITQAASQAAETGWAPAEGNNLRLRIGSTEVSYTVGAGATAEGVASDLNDRLAAAGLGLVASADGGQVAIRTAAYGSAATFDVSHNGGAWATRTGTDVAGTIGGKAGIGTGQQLMISSSDADIPGLTLKISATAADVAGSNDFGTVSYNPGLAQRVLDVALFALDSTNGSLTTARSGTDSKIAEYDRQISRWDTILATREARLRKQFTALDSTIGALRNQSSWLSSQIANLG